MYDESRRSPSRSRDRDFHHDGSQQHVDEDNFNLHVRNLSIETSEDKLRAAFETIGPVKEVNIILEPIQRVSRGFGFVQMERVEDSNTALQTMEGHVIDGNAIKVEKARRKQGYDKTPGAYLGPPGLSVKYGRRGDDRRRDRSRERGGRSRERDNRDRSRDRFPGHYPPPMYRDDRFRDERFAGQPRFREEMRYPPRFDPRFDPRGPPPFHGDGGFDRRSPPREREFRGRRSPSPGHMDRPMDRPRDRDQEFDRSFARGPRY